MPKNTVLGLRTKSQKENLAIKIDGEVLAAVKELEERIEKKFPDLEFSRSAVVESALSEAVSSVNVELDKREKSRPAATA